MLSVVNVRYRKYNAIQGQSTTHLIENKNVNAMTIPRRVLTFVTKWRINIGMVVSNGANIVHTISAALDMQVSSYSASPSSTSLAMNFYAH